MKELIRAFLSKEFGYEEDYLVNELTKLIEDQLKETN